MTGAGLGAAARPILLIIVVPVEVPEALLLPLTLRVCIVFTVAGAGVGAAFLVRDAAGLESFVLLVLDVLRPAASASALAPLIFSPTMVAIAVVATFMGDAGFNGDVGRER